MPQAFLLLGKGTGSIPSKRPGILRFPGKNPRRFSLPPGTLGAPGGGTMLSLRLACLFFLFVLYGGRGLPAAPRQTRDTSAASAEVLTCSLVPPARRCSLSVSTTP